MTPINLPKARLAAGIVVVWVLVAILVSISPPAPPPEWLRSWTVLLSTVIAQAVGLVALWKVPSALRELANRLAPPTNPDESRAQRS